LKQPIADQPRKVRLGRKYCVGQRKSLIILIHEPQK